MLRCVESGQGFAGRCRVVAGQVPMRWRRPVTRAVRAFMAAHEPEAPGDVEPVHVGGDRTRPAVCVLLDRDAGTIIDPYSGRLPVRAEQVVVLRQAGPALGSGQVVVQFGPDPEDRIGVLSAADGAVFESFLRQGIEEGRPVVAIAACSRGDDGSWQVAVYRPGG